MKFDLIERFRLTDETCLVPVRNCATDLFRLPVARYLFEMSYRYPVKTGAGSLLRERLARPTHFRREVF